MLCLIPLECNMWFMVMWLKLLSGICGKDVVHLKICSSKTGLRSSATGSSVAGPFGKMAKNIFPHYTMSVVPFFKDYQNNRKDVIKSSKLKNTILSIQALKDERSQWLCFKKMGNGERELPKCVKTGSHWRSNQNLWDTSSAAVRQSNNLISVPPPGQNTHTCTHRHTLLSSTLRLLFFFQIYTLPLSFL